MEIVSKCGRVPLRGFDFIEEIEVIENAGGDIWLCASGLNIVKVPVKFHEPFPCSMIIFQDVYLDVPWYAKVRIRYKQGPRLEEPQFVDVGKMIFVVRNGMISVYWIKLRRALLVAVYEGGDGFVYKTRIEDADRSFIIRDGVVWLGGMRVDLRELRVVLKSKLFGVVGLDKCGVPLFGKRRCGNKLTTVLGVWKEHTGIEIPVQDKDSMLMKGVLKLHPELNEVVNSVWFAVYNERRDEFLGIWHHPFEMLKRLDDPVAKKFVEVFGRKYNYLRVTGKKAVYSDGKICFDGGEYGVEADVPEGEYEVLLYK